MYIWYISMLLICILCFQSTLILIMVHLKHRYFFSWPYHSSTFSILWNTVKIKIQNTVSSEAYVVTAPGKRGYPNNIFLISQKKKICCRYSLEASCQDTLLLLLLCWDLTTHQPLWVILCRLTEKGRRELVEEMKVRIGEKEENEWK